ncbi:MAG: phospholipase D-like domain-containing protein [Dokdonella sp.]|uniref:phospholipase D-like domain-containing protein n=1 Tax=Dokdonella sp. TaxID=2291710 RepID=UPI003BB10B15
MPALPDFKRDNPGHDPVRLLAAQVLSRAAGAPLIAGNSVDLLIDAERNFEVWREAIRTARSSILFENYIFRDDEVARGMRDLLVDRAKDGVSVHVVRDWLGCLGQSPQRFWQPLVEAGGEVRTYNRPDIGSPLGWLSRDHRKLLVIDDSVGFVGGICVSAKWLGDAGKGIAPWRDTVVAVRGPAVPELRLAFADTCVRLGSPLTAELRGDNSTIASVGEVDLRVIATIPNAAGLYRLDQMIAAMAESRLWLTDAYFVGIAPYVQALSSAARDGVDVRLLVPGTSDIPAIGGLSRAGYRPLLEAGVRVFEWNGSMLHAKTAVADGRWARVGSSNLNLSSWIGNCELDVAIENRPFAERMELQYESDLGNATEIVLGARQRVRRNAVQALPRRRVRGGSSGRAAAGALRLANTMSAAMTNRRVLGPAESTSLGTGAFVLAVIALAAFLVPRLVAWPVGALAAWFAVVFVGRYVIARRRIKSAGKPD